MPDILLIQPPIRDFYLTAKRTIPYGLACIAPALIKNGFSVKILDAMAYLSGQARIPRSKLPYYLGHAWQLVALTRLTPIRFRLPDVVVLLQIDGASAMQRIRVRGRSLQAHESAEALDALAVGHPLRRRHELHLAVRAGAAEDHRGGLHAAHLGGLHVSDHNDPRAHHLILRDLLDEARDHLLGA